MSAGRVRWSLGSFTLSLIIEGPCGAGSELRLGPSSLTWVVYSQRVGCREMEAQCLVRFWMQQSIVDSVLLGFFRILHSD